MCITYSYVSSGSLESSKTVAVDPGTSTTSSFLRTSICEYSKLLHCLVCAQVAQNGTPCLTQLYNNSWQAGASQPSRTTEIRV